MLCGDLNLRFKLAFRIVGWFFLFVFLKILIDSFGSPGINTSDVLNAFDKVDLLLKFDIK